jgi:hypothetical protein
MSVLGAMSEIPLYDILIRRVPGIEAELIAIGEKSCPFKVAAFFADYTKRQIKSVNHEEFKKCLKTADDLLRLGPETHRNAIESVYLFSLTKYFDRDLHLQTYLPLHLKKAFAKQKQAIKTSDRYYPDRL